MGTTARRAREKRSTRERILDAARELFVAEGFEAVTMRKIAEKVEYSPTAIYIHFTDKEALIREICLADFLALANVLSPVLEIPDPIERLQRLGEAYARFAIQHPNHYRLMFMTPGAPKAQVLEKELRRGSPDTDAYAVLEATVADAIAAGRLRPELDDVQLVAQTTWAAVHGVVALEIAKGKDDWVEWRDVDARIRLMCGTMVRGLERRTE